jgi:hypothetical protein
MFLGDSQASPVTVLSETVFSVEGNHRIGIGQSSSLVKLLNKIKILTMHRTIRSFLDPVTGRTLFLKLPDIKPLSFPLLWIRHWLDIRIDFLGFSSKHLELFLVYKKIRCLHILENKALLSSVFQLPIPSFETGTVFSRLDIRGTGIRLLD